MGGVLFCSKEVVFLSSAVPWMNLEDAMLNDISQALQEIPHVLIHWQRLNYIATKNWVKSSPEVGRGQENTEKIWRAWVIKMRCSKTQGLALKFHSTVGGFSPQQLTRHFHRAWGELEGSCHRNGDGNGDGKSCYPKMTIMHYTLDQLNNAQL